MNNIPPHAQIPVINGIAASHTSHQMAMDLAETARGLEIHHKIIHHARLLYACAFDLEHAYAEALVSHDITAPMPRFIYLRSMACLALKVCEFGVSAAMNRATAQRALKVLLQESLDELLVREADQLRDLMQQLSKICSQE